MASHTARCACGACTITVTAPPVVYGICHCANCKRRTGSAFGISMYFERAAVTATTGATQVYAFRHAELKHDQARHFCARCGTTLFWTISSLPDRIGIAGGCFEGEPFGEPGYSIRQSQKLPWVGLPGHWTVED